MVLPSCWVIQAHMFFTALIANFQKAKNVLLLLTPGKKQSRKVINLAAYVNLKREQKLKVFDDNSKQFEVRNSVIIVKN